MPREIKYPLKTDNTLVIGTINPNHEVPSLRDYLESGNSEGSPDTMISKIFNGSDSERLKVESMSDVTRIFKPTYYFRIHEDRLHLGRGVNAVEHSLVKPEGDACAIEISKESLCFKVLENNGRIDLTSLKKDVLKSLRRGLRDYVMLLKKKRAGIQVDALVKKQLDLRRDFVLRLTEPVTLYHLAAEALRNTKVILPAGETGSGEGAPSPNGVFLIVDPEKMEVRVEPVASQNNVAESNVSRSVVVDESTAVDLNELETDEYIAGKYLPKFLDALETAEGVSEQQRKDYEHAARVTGFEIDLDSRSENMNPETSLRIQQDTITYLEGHRNLLLPEVAESGKNGKKKKKNSQAIMLRVEGEDNGQYFKKVQKQVGLMRREMDSEDLDKNLNTIQDTLDATLHKESKAYKALSKYLLKITPEGLIETEMNQLLKDGDHLLHGPEGERLYFKLCIEEAAKKLGQVNKFRELLFNAIFDVKAPVKPEEETSWKEMHDKVLDIARASFKGYMEALMPLVSQLKGIDDFLTISSAAKSKERKPNLVIANCDLSDLGIADGEQAVTSAFHGLLAELNREAREGFKKAISLIVVPELHDTDADSLFRVAYDTNALVLFGNGRNPLNYQELTQERLEELKSQWASEEPHYKAAMLCAPDRIQLPIGFEFVLGEKLMKETPVSYATERAVAIRSCYSIAGLLARNNDYQYLKSLSFFKKKKGQPKWPGFNVNGESKEILHNLPYSSEGVSPIINNVETQPICMIEHAQDPDLQSDLGMPRRQHVVVMNTLYSDPAGRPVPLAEYRVAAYMSRFIALNKSEDRRGNLAALMRSVRDSDRFNTILKPGDELVQEENQVYLSRKIGDVTVRHLL